MNLYVKFVDYKIVFVSDLRKNKKNFLKKHQFGEC